MESWKISLFFMVKSDYFIKNNIIPGITPFFNDKVCYKIMFYGYITMKIQWSFSFFTRKIGINSNFYILHFMVFVHNFRHLQNFSRMFLYLRISASVRWHMVVIHSLFLRTARGMWAVFHGWKTYGFLFLVEEQFT